jgi:hypothetical protein
LFDIVRLAIVLPLPGQEMPRNAHSLLASLASVVIPAIVLFEILTVPEDLHTTPTKRGIGPEGAESDVNRIELVSVALPMVFPVIVTVYAEFGE